MGSVWRYLRRGAHEELAWPRTQYRRSTTMTAELCLHAITWTDVLEIIASLNEVKVKVIPRDEVHHDINIAPSKAKKTANRNTRD